MMFCALFRGSGLRTTAVRTKPSRTLVSDLFCRISERFRKKACPRVIGDFHSVLDEDNVLVGHDAVMVSEFYRRLGRASGSE